MKHVQFRADDQTYRLIEQLQRDLGLASIQDLLTFAVHELQRDPRRGRDNPVLGALTPEQHRLLVDLGTVMLSRPEAANQLRGLVDLLLRRR